MLRFIDLACDQQQLLYGKVLSLKQSGLGYKRIRRKISEDFNVRLHLSTLSYWFNHSMDLNLLGGENHFTPKPSPELSYVIGVIFGDGSVTFNKKKQDYKITLMAKDLDFVKKFSITLAKLLHKQKSYPIHPTKLRHYTAAARSKKMYFFLKSLKEDFEKVKPWVEPYPKEFIQGLADSEGTAAVSVSEKSRLVYGIGVAYSTNAVLLAYIQSLLSKNFHISSTLRKCKSAGMKDSIINGRIITRTKNLFSLIICGLSNVQKFSRSIGFSINRKQERIILALKIIKKFGPSERVEVWKKFYHKEGRFWIKNKGAEPSVYFGD